MMKNLLKLSIIIIGVFWMTTTCDREVTVETCVDENFADSIVNPYNITIVDVPIVNSIPKEVEKKKSYWEVTPYNTFPEYVQYFKSRAITFQEVHKVPYEMILSKAWTETHAGKTGAGVKTAIFGIKGKGVKGYDKKEAQNVEYNGYEFRWQAYSDFCKLVKKPFYVERFKAWKRVYPEKPDYYNYNLALQAHPNPNLGRTAYASCGCKSGLDSACRKLRLKHAYKNIEIIEKYIK